MARETGQVRAAFVGFGEVNTPREWVEEQCAAAEAALEEKGLSLVRTAPVSDDRAGSGAARAVADLSGQDFDLLVLCLAGWIPSWAVLAVCDAFRHKPMVLLGLTGRREKDRFVTAAAQAGTTALRRPMADMGYRFKYLPTRLGADLPLEEIISWARAAAAAGRLRKSRIGMAGYRDMGLYGTGYDPVSLKSVFGTEIEHCDLLELERMMAGADPAEAAALGARMLGKWEFAAEARPETIEKSARFCLALQRKISARGYDAFSYCDVDGVKELMGFAPAGALTLFHDVTAGIPTIPENDALGSITQLMVRHLTGQVGAYLEFYEFLDRGALMGVPDYVPAEIVSGPVRVLPSAFGEFGEGLLNVSRLKTGRVTICRLAQSNGRFQLHIAAGRADAPAPWEEVGWAAPAPQLPSLEITFDGDADGFIDQVMSQHYIIAYGDHGGALRDLAGMLGIDCL